LSSGFWPGNSTSSTRSFRTFAIRAAAFSSYNREQQWDIVCREIAKLNVGQSLFDGAVPLLGAVELLSVEKVSASGGTRTLRAQIENQR
jgi:hypothetical protein